MQKIGQLLQQRTPATAKAALPRYEFQIYGEWLAQMLEDEPRKTLYIKLAKEEERSRLERALEHVMASRHVRKKGALFMYRLKQLRDAHQAE